MVKRPSLYDTERRKPVHIVVRRGVVPHVLVALDGPDGRPRAGRGILGRARAVRARSPWNPLQSAMEARAKSGDDTTL